MSRPRIVMSTAVLIAGVFGASWYASTLFPILKAAKADVQASASSAAGDSAVAQSDSRVMHIVDDGKASLPAGDVALRGSRAVVLFDQQTGNVLAIRPVTPITPENPIPRRTRGVTPVRPSQFGAVQVVVSPLVTLDRTGAVTAVVRDGCSVIDGVNNDDAVCAAFFDAVATAVRQWRYERPVQAPIQFYVNVTFKPGVEPTVTQTGEIWAAYVRETQGRARRLAETDRDNETVQRAVASLQADLARVTDMSRELERAQLVAIERGTPSPDMVRLQQETARLNDEMMRIQKQLQQQLEDPRPQERRDDLVRLMSQLQMVRQSVALRSREEEERALRAHLDANARAAEQTRAATERLREAQRRLAEVRLAEAAASLERSTTTTAALSGEAAPADASRQLVSPSGRTPLRVTPPVTAPVPIKTPKPQHSAEAMRARVEGTVTIEALVDEQGHVADARVLKSIPLLDQSALEAAKQWEFRPALLNGEPVPVLVVLELDFRLRN